MSIAPSRMIWRTSTGVSDGFIPSTNAANPATCGEDMLVPLLPVIELPPAALLADQMLAPGAATSR
jgi:hypothetical protein